MGKTLNIISIYFSFPFHFQARAQILYPIIPYDSKDGQLKALFIGVNSQSKF